MSASSNRDSPIALFTSLRYDAALKQAPARGLRHAGWNYDHESPFYMLDFHRDRILRAATHWQWSEAIANLSGDDALRRLAAAAQEHIGPAGTEPLRLRIVVDSRGAVGFQTFATPAAPLENLLPGRLPPPGSAPGPGEPRVPPRYALVVDGGRVARSEFTHYKTTRRAVYDAARQRAGIGPGDHKEVLMVSADDGFVTEGSTTTPYFWRGGRWITPPVAAEFSWQEGSGGQDGTTRRWALERGLAAEQVVPVDSLVNGEECWISSGVGGFRLAVVSLGRPAGPVNERSQ